MKRLLKRLCVHIGVGIGLLVLSYFAPKLFNAALDWLDRNGIVGASWLGVATWELAIGTVVILGLWGISFLALPCRWHARFRQAAMYYGGGVLGLGGGVTAVAVPGFISMWFYRNGIWPVGAVFRLVEIGAALAVLVGLAFWIFGMVYSMFIPCETEKDAPFRFPRALFIGWVCLVGVLLVSLGHYAWRYSLGPTSRTATDQAQLEDCAMAVVGCVHFSASDDPSDLASVAEGKQALKDMIQGYDRASLDEVCSIVDESLRFERSLQNDLLAYMDRLSRTGGTSRFKMSERTREILDKLPNRLRANFMAGDLMEAEQMDGKGSNLPKNWREIMDDHSTRIWAIYGQTYSELLGRPMPSPTD